MRARIEELEEIKRRIFNKVERRIRQLQIRSSTEGPEPPPDVIVIPDDHSLLFEVQSLRALQLLTQVCGFAPETLTLPERIRVHHCRSRHIIAQLKAAGVMISGEP